MISEVERGEGGVVTKVRKHLENVHNMYMTKIELCISSLVTHLEKKHKGLIERLRKDLTRNKWAELQEDGEHGLAHTRSERKRGDMITTFNFLCQFDNLDDKQFFDTDNYQREKIA